MRSRLVVLRCDASRQRGAGHLMRCIGLAEALRHQGLDVLFLSNIASSPLGHDQFAARSLQCMPAPTEGDALVRRLREVGAAAAVIDSYDIAPDVYTAVRRVMPVVALVDAPAPSLDADLLVNQNLGAVTAMSQPHRGRVLAGVRYALVRDEVAALRPRLAPSREPVKRVLVVVGGTDVQQATPSAVRAVLDTGRPLHVDVMSGSPDVRRALAAQERRQGQTLAVHPVGPSLPALARRSQLAVTATGTTVWELACLATPMALVTAAANQMPSYDRLVAEEVAIGLGPAADLAEHMSSARTALDQLIEDAPRRARMAAAGHSLVDGDGAARVARAVEALL
jgi:spore coat polysaccharide biosynthesis predicted glycosyltransferase SpsG